MIILHDRMISAFVVPYGLFGALKGPNSFAWQDELFCLPILLGVYLGPLLCPSLLFMEQCSEVDIQPLHCNAHCSCQ